MHDDGVMRPMGVDCFERVHDVCEMRAHGVLNVRPLDCCGGRIAAEPFVVPTARG